MQQVFMKGGKATGRHRGPLQTRRPERKETEIERGACASSAWSVAMACGSPVLGGARNS
jgi:hypothetical protein